MQEEREAVVHQERKRVGMPIRILAYTAVLTALSVVANIFDITYGPSNAQRFSVTYFINFVSGAFLGPFSGFLTGLIGDLLGFWIKPSGDFNPIIMAASALSGLIPGLVFFFFRGKDKQIKYPIVAAIVSMILVFLICSSLNTVGLYVYYFRAKGRTLGAVFALRALPQTISWVINAFLSVSLYLPLKKMLKLENI